MQLSDSSTRESWIRGGDDVARATRPIPAFLPAHHDRRSARVSRPLPTKERIKPRLPESVAAPVPSQPDTRQTLRPSVSCKSARQRGPAWHEKGCMSFSTFSPSTNPTLALFTAPVRAWFEAAFPEGPTPAQECAWPPDRRGRARPSGLADRHRQDPGRLSGDHRPALSGARVGNAGTPGLQLRLCLPAPQSQLRHRTQPEHAAGRNRPDGSAVKRAPCASAFGPATHRPTSAGSCATSRRTC